MRVCPVCLTQISGDAEAVLMQALVATPESGRVPTAVNFGTALARALLDSTSAVRAIVDEDLPPTPQPDLGETLAPPGGRDPSADGN